MPVWLETSLWFAFNFAKYYYTNSSSRSKTNCGTISGIYMPGIPSYLGIHQSITLLHKVAVVYYSVCWLNRRKASIQTPGQPSPTK